MNNRELCGSYAEGHFKKKKKEGKKSTNIECNQLHSVTSASHLAYT